ncbi:MAG: 3-keto-5-aminohexanoate cleavage protein [Chloroflexota bacterium]
MSRQKVIISAALTGALTTRAQCPAIPYTPAEIADEGLRAVEAGAAILHIHARNDDGSPTFAVSKFEEIKAEVRARCPDVIINFSTGAIGLPREERIAHVLATKPDMAALNMGSMNYAIYSKKAKKFYHDFVFQNPFKDIGYFLEKMKSVGTRPEMESFDTGHIHNANPFIDMGLLPKPYTFSFVMGVLGGIPATPENLLHQSRQIPSDAFWQSIVISRKQWAIASTAITAGGNFRVGLEDNFYLPDGEMAKSNGELVAAGVTLARTLGREPASIAETRDILTIPLRD